jgi:hypothetical protein
MACSDASREGRWLLQLCTDPKQHDNNHDDDNDDENDDNYKNNKLLPILCNNKHALTHIINGTIKAQMTHIILSYRNSGDLHERSIDKYTWMSTQEYIANFFMKALPREKHEKCTKARSLG